MLALRRSSPRPDLLLVISLAALLSLAIALALANETALSVLATFRAPIHS